MGSIRYYRHKCKKIYHLTLSANYGKLSINHLPLPHENRSVNISYRLV